MDGVESSAVKIIMRAVELETDARLQPALTCYQEGIDLLLEVLKSCQDPEKKKRYRQKVSEYMTRAEQIKEMVKRQKEEGKYHELIHIKENETGFGYEKVFGSYLDHTVTEVHVEDAYIRNFPQINNFLQLCELLVLKCTNLKTINLMTTRDMNQHHQADNLDHIRTSLLKRSISLIITFSDSLHDREIRLNNGWIIKIGRGLDYFKRADKLSIGLHNLNLRTCHATTIDVFHSKHTKEK
ncbi:MIT domain-containing protein 1-like [Styela clava]|uniref:MIT domain-containing protein 1-like n=1 Tax=Styela clava TaxID=7725 RepID=UPI0019393A82|nr:MIT domain-containing protein 1-like [Styela clava]